MATTDNTRQSSDRRLARLGVFGDLPVTLVHRILARVPWFLEPALTAAWTLLFFLLAGPQRRAVASNLGAMFPEWSGPRRMLGAWRVFWNFAATFVDAARFETGTGGVDWAIDGLDAMDRLNATPGGCIVLTAHMGNYDLAAPVFASRFTRTLHTVRAPERMPETQAVREREIRRREERYPGFRTHYNTPGGMLGVELARFIAAGDIVAVQGDRVLFDVSPMIVEVAPGLMMRLPKGPMALARATGAPCRPVFITRDGWRHYRVTVMEEIALPPRRRGDEAEVSSLWAAPIHRMARSHWNQWFVFEPVFSRKIPG
jgi:phosphatidylinositol dimannoside acyltransferase